MPRDDSTIASKVARREVERHKIHFIGVTVSQPTYKDFNGVQEYVANVRVGTREDWSIIADCLIAQWAVGIITDMNVPVICEKSESGRVTIVARSEVNLPDIVLDNYSYEELGFGFMRNLTASGGKMYDAFGYAVGDENIDGELDVAEGVKQVNYRYYANIIGWGDTDFLYGITPLGAVDSGWEEI